MNPADDEINILLPLMFLIFIGIILLVFGVTLFILYKLIVFEGDKSNNILTVLKYAIFSLIGVFLFSGILGAIVIILQYLLGFFSK